MSTTRIKNWGSGTQIWKPIKTQIWDGGIGHGRDGAISRRPVTAEREWGMHGEKRKGFDRNCFKNRSLKSNQWAIKASLPTPLIKLREIHSLKRWYQKRMSIEQKSFQSVSEKKRKLIMLWNAGKRNSQKWDERSVTGRRLMMFVGFVQWVSYFLLCCFLSTCCFLFQSKILLIGLTRGIFSDDLMDYSF